MRPETVLLPLNGRPEIAFEAGATDLTVCPALIVLALVGDVALLVCRGGAVLTLRLFTVVGVDLVNNDTLGFARKVFVGLSALASFRSPFILPPIADAGRDGMGLSGLKKLDLRRRIAGDWGILAIDSIVRSTRDGRDFERAGGVHGSIEDGLVSETTGPSLLWTPARDPARDDAREADLNPSRLPTASSASLLLADTTRFRGCGRLCLNDDGPVGFLNRCS
jgi:hypothetical protein